MAGHSKWANIKRQKAVVDARRGSIFTQLSRAIIVAARNGIPDPAGNFQLRTAIDKAKAAGIPNDNIDRAVAKGAGTFSDNNILEEIRYEGYGPGGVAILIEASQITGIGLRRICASLLAKMAETWEKQVV